MFSLSSVNLTYVLLALPPPTFSHGTCRTDAEAEAYIHSNYFPTLSLDDLASVFEAYPSDPSAGSPFDTGSANAITPV